MNTKSKPEKLNIPQRLAVIFIICCLILPMTTAAVRADAVTDTLTVKVGYLGMEMSEYVTVGTYHWRELKDNMELHDIAYSFYQSSSKKTEYTAIVDSARGFYVSDLLDYAGIYYGDVKNLKFYVEDHKGIRTSFDTSALFKTRYYYKDLAGQRKILYGTRTVEEEVTETVHHDAEYETNEDGEKVLVKDAYDEKVTKTVTKEVEDKSKIVGYSFDKAKGSKVSPMLAVEDNWASFNEEFEHIGSDFSSLNAGNRFRILFGQTSPTESGTTGLSDKYISCIYVTLAGKPTVGEMGGLNGKYGSHKVTMQVSADNINIRNALSELMNVKSTNTSVLVITGVTVTPDSKYSDLATVEISYDIVGAGEASITAGVGQSAEPIATTETVTGEGDPKGNTEKENSKSNSGGSSKKSKGQGSVEKKANKTEAAADKNELKQQQKAGQQEAGSASTFELSEEAAAELNEALQSQTLTAATEELTEVKENKEDKEKKEKEQKKLLLLTGLGVIVTGAGGGAAEAVSFRMRLRGRKNN